MKPVKDIHVNKRTSITDLLNQYYESGGFVAKDVGIGVRILKRMVDDQRCTKFLSFPACVVATGTRGVLKDLIKNRLVDVVITTCGTLDHDLARVWKDYYHGSFFMNDSELHKKEVHRLGNVIIPKDSYGTLLENKLQPFLKMLWEQGIKEISEKLLSMKRIERVQ
jgi:deoxyhypusine synthase